MTKPHTITIVGLILILSSCMYLGREPEKHQDFMSHSDCFVYENEVKVENFDFGRVEFIDTSKFSECSKEQLKNVYLLYYNNICVAIYNQHPKENIETVKYYIEKYQTDTTRLSNFVQFDSTIKLTIDRLCKDINDDYYYEKYVWWRDIEYSTVSKPYRKMKDEILQTWYRWTD